MDILNTIVLNSEKFSMNVNKYDTLNVTVMNSAENLTLNTLESKTLWMNESEENSTVFYDYYGDQNSAYIFYILKEIFLSED